MLKYLNFNLNKAMLFEWEYYIQKFIVNMDNH